MNDASAELKKMFDRCLRERSGKEQKRFADMQKAWERYSTLHCSEQLEIYEGGSGGPAAYAFCMEQLTKKRIDDLSPDYS